MHRDFTLLSQFLLETVVLEVEYYSQADSASGTYISRFTILDNLLAGFYKTKNDYTRIKRAVHTDMLGGVI